MNIEEAERLLRQKLQAARDSGVRLVHHRTRVFQGDRVVACCVLGAFYLELPKESSRDIPLWERAKDLGPFAAQALMVGWDQPRAFEHMGSPWHELGARLHEEFEPVLDGRALYGA